MKKILTFLFIYLTFFGITNIFANSGTMINNNDQVQIFLELSSQEVNIGENFRIILNITNSGNLIQINNPEIIGIENFTIHGTSQSTNMSIINNNVSNKTIFSFNAKPLKSGIFEIGPSKINIGGNIFESNIVKIKVNDLNLNNQNNIDVEFTPDLKSNKSHNFFNLEKFIYIFGIILIFGIIVSYFYIAHIDNKKKIAKPEKITQTYIPKISIDYLEENKYLNIIHNYFNKNYDIDAKNLTFKELLFFEKNPTKKDILEKIFNLLNQKLYSNHEINKEELGKLIKKFIQI